MSADEPPVPDELAWALCPHLQFMLDGVNSQDRPCKQCPAMAFYAEVESFGTSFCRYMADKAGRTAMDVMEAQK